MGLFFFLLLCLITLISYSCLAISSDFDREADDRMQEEYIEKENAGKKGFLIIFPLPRYSAAILPFSPKQIL